MKLASALLIGIAASTLMASLPAAARDDFTAGSFQIARRGGDDSFRGEREDDSRRSTRRQRDDDRGYGFGYERRRQSGDDGADDRNRSTEEDRGDRRDRRDDRRDSGGRR
jgi:hypothetical protein